MGAVAQVTDKGLSATSVAGRLGANTKSFYDWVMVGKTRLPPLRMLLAMERLCYGKSTMTS